MYGFIIAAAVIVIVILVMVFARRGVKGLTLMSHLQCPKCGGEFDYVYIPGISFTSIRMGGSRLLRCPVCGKSSVFDLSNRVDPKTHHCARRVGPS
jgi:hypothetical protein